MKPYRLTDITPVHTDGRNSTDIILVGLYYAASRVVNSKKDICIYRVAQKWHHVYSLLLISLKCIVTEVVLLSIVAFKTLDISQGSVATHLRAGGFRHGRLVQT